MTKEQKELKKFAAWMIEKGIKLNDNLNDMDLVNLYLQYETDIKIKGEK